MNKGLLKILYYELRFSTIVLLSISAFISYFFIKEERPLQIINQNQDQQNNFFSILVRQNSLSEGWKKKLLKIPGIQAIRLDRLRDSNAKLDNFAKNNRDIFSNGAFDKRFLVFIYYKTNLNEKTVGLLENYLKVMFKNSIVMPKAKLRVPTEKEILKGKGIAFLKLLITYAFWALTIVLYIRPIKFVLNYFKNYNNDLNQFNVFIILILLLALITDVGVFILLKSKDSLESGQLLIMLVIKYMFLLIMLGRIYNFTGSDRIKFFIDNRHEN